MAENIRLYPSDLYWCQVRLFICNLMPARLVTRTISAYTLEYLTHLLLIKRYYERTLQF